MTYCRIEATTTVSVPNFKNLLAAWKMHGPTHLVGTFKCDKPLTDAQLRRLPAGLREALAL